MIVRCDRDGSVHISPEDWGGVQRSIDILIERVAQLEHNLDKLQDLTCKHTEIANPIFAIIDSWGKPVAVEYYCKRCGKKMDPKVIGQVELEKRVGKEA